MAADEESMMAAAMQMSCSLGEASKGTVSMDGRLWGNLQDHIHLTEQVYARVPIGEFFRMRLVCKEWNQMASDQKFLERTTNARAIPSPYFVMGGRQPDSNWPTVAKSWLLYYDPWARRWSWTRLPPWVYEADGLLYDSVESVVFNVHTRIFHKLPPRPRLDQAESQYNMLGMTVSRSATGRFSFRANFLAPDHTAWTYASESGFWSQQVCRYGLDGRHAISRRNRRFPVVNMFLRKRRTDGVITAEFTKEYNWVRGKSGLENMVWSLIDDWNLWQGRALFFGLKLEYGKVCVITAFEHMNSAPGRDWMFFDQMPDDVCAWMLTNEIKNEIRDNRGFQKVQTRFADEFVLVYVALGLAAVAKRAVLYNLEQKTWKKVEVQSPCLHPSLQPLFEKGFCHACNL